MQEERPTTPQARLHAVPRASWPILLAGAAAIALLAFLLGFVPMWTKAKNQREKLQVVERQQVVLQLQGMLASCAINARRGRYEPARQQTSEFYTALNAELKQGAGSAFTPAQIEGVTPIVGQRDEIITLLARSDPAAADRLIDLFVVYQKAIENGSSEAKGGG